MRTNLREWSLLASAIVVLALAAVASAQMTKEDEEQRMNTESHIGNLTGHAAAAKTDYRRYCVGCHGEEGDGLGENEPWLDPKPRNFTLGQFKCRSADWDFAHRRRPL